MFYGNADDFRVYMNLRGKTSLDDWSDEKIESALLVASEWLDSQFESIWIGWKTDGFKQERSWPRYNAVVQSYPYYIFQNDEIPEQVVKATYEAAYREGTSQGCLQTDYIPNIYKRVEVHGAVSVDYNDFINSASDTQLEVPVIQKLMDPLIDPDKLGTVSSLSGKAVRV